jgi:protein-tyrosine phosphatase
MADGLLRKKVAELDLDVFVDSAGTSGLHAGEKPDPRMRATALSMGVDIDMLRSRKFNQADFDEFDLIYAMDTSNYNNILSLTRNEADKQKVLLILNELQPGKNLQVPDPYYGGEQGFVDVFNMLDAATDKIIEKIKKNG